MNMLINFLAIIFFVLIILLTIWTSKKTEILSRWLGEKFGSMKERFVIWTKVDVLKNRLSNWIEKHPIIKTTFHKAKIGLITIFWLWLAISIGIGIIDIVSKYKTPHQKRLEFLEINCEKVDEGYEILSGGKSTYKLE